VPDELKENANAVVRLSDLSIQISSQKSMTLKSKIVITVYNEYGLKNLNLLEYYDKNRRVSKLEATVYDSFGKEIKTYKKRDFKERSVADGVSIFNDNRALYLDFTPTSYPFTMVTESEIETSNTAFIPSWSPIDGYFVSTEKTNLSITYKPDLKLKFYEKNFSEALSIKKSETGSTLSYTAESIKAIKKEDLSPNLYDLVPIVFFSLENFHLESVDGTAKNWTDFGQWYFNSILSDTEELPAATIEKIKQLVGNEKDPIEIAKIVYKFVQNKTRYVSVQVGIGGWKPMLAKDVDKLGYGDCKALTNYTRVLLKNVGVASYYTVVYAGSDEKKNINKDFVSIQGNHVILALPTDKEMIWLECTSQIQPFGLQGDFTDDRNVLVIKPEGGEIVKTKTYDEKETTKFTKASYQMLDDGTIKGKVEILSKGLHYDNAFSKERMGKEQQVELYKEQYNNVNNLKIDKISINNDTDTILFNEQIEVSATNYAQINNGKLIFVLNAFDQNVFIPKKYKSRENSFRIIRGFNDQSETEISIPADFKIEAKPQGIELNSEFVYYKIEFNQFNDKLICKRKLIVKQGLFGKENYEIYRKFRETIAKSDSSKVILTKI
jgi:transglutaminase-like putative cysteine protease